MSLNVSNFNMWFPFYHYYIFCWLLSGDVRVVHCRRVLENWDFIFGKTYHYNNCINIYIWIKFTHTHTNEMEKYYQYVFQKSSVGQWQSIIKRVSWILLFFLFSSLYLFVDSIWIIVYYCDRRMRLYGIVYIEHLCSVIWKDYEMKYKPYFQVPKTDSNWYND